MIEKLMQMQRVSTAKNLHIKDRLATRAEIINMLAALRQDEKVNLSEINNKLVILEAYL